MSADRGGTVEVRETRAAAILVRTGGYLSGVASHSLQPYRGCTFGRSLCGVGCYVRANPWITRGREWGSFLEARSNAAERYSAEAEREARWAHRRGERFAVFCSSSTDPFVPQERRFGITRAVLEAACRNPPDLWIMQTHSPHVADDDVLERLSELARRTEVRVHVSIESDRDRLPGLPPSASTVEARLEACARVRERGIRVVATVAPLLPIAEPERFFARLAEVVDAVVLDHFVGGDGSAGGARTLRTALPAAMAAVDPESVELGYLERMLGVARRCLGGRVGVGASGFAGCYDA